MVDPFDENDILKAKNIQLVSLLFKNSKFPLFNQGLKILLLKCKLKGITLPSIQIWIIMTKKFISCFMGKKNKHFTPICREGYNQDISSSKKCNV